MGHLIDAFLNEQVEIKPYIRMSGGGTPVYGETETRACRMEMGAYLRGVYKAASGQIDQVEARAKMFCTGNKIPSDSIVTYDGEDYKVIDCQIMRGFGYSHLEVVLA